MPLQGWMLKLSWSCLGRYKTWRNWCNLVCRKTRACISGPLTLLKMHMRAAKPSRKRHHAGASRVRVGVIEQGVRESAVHVTETTILT